MYSFQFLIFVKIFSRYIFKKYIQKIDPKWIQTLNSKKWGLRFRILFFLYICWIVFVYIFEYFYEDEELETIHFSLLNSTPTWIWISFLSQTWTEFYSKLCILKECTLNFCQGRYPIFQGRYPKPFYFQER